MKLEIIDWLIICLVPVFALLANIYYKSKNPDKPSRRNFGLANQNLGGIAVASTYIGANITFTSIFIILSQEGYKRTYWAFTIPLFWLVGTFVFVLLYPKIRDYIISGKTLHQTIGETFKSTSLKFYASMWTIIAFVLTVGLEFYGGIKLISASNMPFLSYVSIGIIFIIVVGYFTAKGGLGGVAYADIVLDLFTLAGIIVLTAGLFTFIGSLFHNNFATITSINPKMLEIPSFTLEDNIIFTVSMFILFVPFQFCTFDSWQRLSARKERKKSPNSLIITAGLVVSICFCIPIIIGMYMRQESQFVDLKNNELVLFKFLEYQKYSSIWIGVIFAGFIASVFSTADELLNCCSYSFLSDALEVEETEEINKNNLDYSYKFYVIVFCILAAILALLGLWKEKEITDIGLAIFSTQIVFILPLFFVFFKPSIAYKYGKAVKYSMITSFFSSIIFVILGWVIDDKSLVEGAPLGALVVELFTYFILRIFIKPQLIS